MEDVFLNSANFAQQVLDCQKSLHFHVKIFYQILAHERNVINQLDLNSSSLARLMNSAHNISGNKRSFTLPRLPRLRTTLVRNR